MARDILPYGCWPSPVSARTVAGKSLHFGTLQASQGAIFWSESRPDEGGRGVIVMASAGGSVQELLPKPWSARSKVHEYGGGEFLASDERVFFVEADSQDIYELVDGEPRRITSEPETRFADLTLDPARNRLIAVAELYAGCSQNPENLLVAVALSDAPEAAVEVIVSGQDFYATPRLSPDGTMLAWLAWDLPHMPWENAALHVAHVKDDGATEPDERIAGGWSSAVFQPEWGVDGRLYFVWDESGWGRLHTWDGNDTRVLTPDHLELMRPQWVFRMQSYALLDKRRAAATFFENGETRLAFVDLSCGSFEPVETDLRGIDALAPLGKGIAVVGASDCAAPAVVSIGCGGTVKTLRSAGETGIGSNDVSAGETLRFEGEGGELYALYYPAANANYKAPEAELPPVVVTIHGGPTGMADRGLKLKTQFWTSRGFAVCELDYSGSAGYGRAYRERLDGQWGVRDVSDVASLTRYLAASRRADPKRLLISGGSAGGYTVLMALATLDVFAAAACYYGVSDLAQLQRMTHKFESGYLYGLTGAMPEDADEVFSDRSPMSHADRIEAPVIFFQGLEDKVVPPEQSRSMVNSLRQRGVPLAYLEFPDEGHGFRSSETIVTALESEHAFYVRVLGLGAPGELRPVEIENWDSRAGAN